MKVKFAFFYIVALALLLVLPLSALGVADDALIQVVDTGYIDWSNGTVRVRGVAAPAGIDDEEAPGSPSDILSAARRMAEANLLETVSAIPIIAVSRVADRMDQSIDFREGLISLARTCVPYPPGIPFRWHRGN